ncbi:hypothetical protein B0H16DRAFT_1452907 [Mycena metata]|uniref:Uncharacterized protein n=1 Tax=Mycena metata TaxID=1033252 RepID=A0AAD7JQ39_9AGAR|nr:hypothetical protein B0H16DRAFT_1452907 [Mycena metata]
MAQQRRGLFKPGVRRPAVLAGCILSIVLPRGTANSNSHAGGSGGTAAGCHLTNERTRLEGDTTVGRSEERADHDEPPRESGLRAGDEHPAESSVQERIVVDAEELQAPHRLTSRDLVRMDEDTAGVSSRPAIGLRAASAMLNPVQGRAANVADALQAPRENTAGPSSRTTELGRNWGPSTEERPSVRRTDTMTPWLQPMTTSSTGVFLNPVQNSAAGPSSRAEELGRIHGLPPEEIPSFMLVDTNAPLVQPAPAPAPPRPPPNPPTLRAHGRADSIFEVTGT